jgi:hypothetical protein
MNQLNDPNFRTAFKKRGEHKGEIVVCLKEGHNGIHTKGMEKRMIQGLGVSCMVFCFQTDQNNVGKTIMNKLFSKSPFLFL